MTKATGVRWTSYKDDWDANLERGLVYDTTRGWIKKEDADKLHERERKTMKKKKTAQKRREKRYRWIDNPAIESQILAIKEKLKKEGKDESLAYAIARRRYNTLKGKKTIGVANRMARKDTARMERMERRKKEQSIAESLMEEYGWKSTRGMWKKDRKRIHAHRLEQHVQTHGTRIKQANDDYIDAGDQRNKAFRRRLDAIRSRKPRSDKYWGRQYDKQDDRASDALERSDIETKRRARWREHELSNRFPLATSSGPPNESRRRFMTGGKTWIGRKLAKLGF